jgi:hypothetical protein
MDDSTNRMGSLTPGREVEVRGRLNEKLEVEAGWVKSDDAPTNGQDDNNGNHGNGNTGGGTGGNTGGNGNNGMPGASPVRKSIALTAAAGLRIEGQAEIEIEVESSRIEQQFEVEIEKAEAGREYRISVDLSGAGTSDLGTLVTDSQGRAKVKFTTKAGVGSSLSGLLPAGKTVADIAAVRVLLGGAVVLTGRF